MRLQDGRTDGQTDRRTQSQNGEVYTKKIKKKSKRKLIKFFKEKVQQNFIYNKFF